VKDSIPASWILDLAENHHISIIQSIFLSTKSSTELNVYNYQEWDYNLPMQTPSKNVINGECMLPMRKNVTLILILMISILSLVPGVSAQEPVIHAVLFYSPSCPHCMTVINEILPQLDQQYGSQLVIFGMNTYTDKGHQLYENAALAFNTPEERQGVPTIIVGDQVLVGAYEISEIFPQIIEEGIKNGGIDWPAIPDLHEIMDTPKEKNPEEITTTSHNLTVADRFNADFEGNIISVFVLLGMVGALIFSAANFLKGNQVHPINFPDWLIPLLSLIGIGIAGYLSFVEYNQVEAICGPVGNCNTVQQSSYARLFGVIPVGFLGLLGYISVIILWLLDLLDIDALRQLPRLGLWIITLFGTLFSV
jgi:uncharacterized membrane protein/thiol-disulfide isomerase/thioredoxin